MGREDPLEKGITVHIYEFHILFRWKLRLYNFDFMTSSPGITYMLLKSDFSLQAFPRNPNHPVSSSSLNLVAFLGATHLDSACPLPQTVDLWLSWI